MSLVDCVKYCFTLCSIIWSRIGYIRNDRKGPQSRIIETKAHQLQPVKNLVTAEHAFPKIKYFCAYRERCHYEVREKLFGMGLPKTEVDQLVVRLIEEDFLNEERYSIQFAGSHFRVKKWGKKKIEYALRQKRISEPNIKRAIKEIESADYEQTLQKLAIKKWEILVKEAPVSRQAKTTAFLLQKGYEAQKVQQAIARIRVIEKNKVDK